jgi:RNA polymerase sigma factor (sigma-70 family)
VDVKAREADGFRAVQTKANCLRRTMSLAVSWPWTQRGEDPAVYLDDVFRYARSRLASREDAEDIACEVAQSLPSPCRRRDLRVYMIGMARRKIADRLRKARGTVQIQEPDQVVRFDDVSDSAALVEQVLSKLTEDQREALTLKYVVGLTSEEVGQTVGKSSEAIDSLLQRGRASFAREWNALSSEEVNL